VKVPSSFLVGLANAVKCVRQVSFRASRKQVFVFGKRFFIFAAFSNPKKQGMHFQCYPYFFVFSSLAKFKKSLRQKEFK